MTLKLLIPIVLAGFSSVAAGQDSEFAAGRAYYGEGEFRKAVAHFRVALKANPDDADGCYWMGMSYQRMADVATPFGGKYKSKALAYLTKATRLAPSRRDYRQALFDLLLDSSDSSRAAWRQAAGILLTMPETDPDYSEMRRRLYDVKKAKFSADALLGRLWLMAPRAAYRIAALPTSALSGRHMAVTLLPTEQRPIFESTR